MNAGGGSFKSQMKKADASGARLALIVGEDELAAGAVTVKPLRGKGDQESLVRGDLLRWMEKLLPARYAGAVTAT